MDERLADHPELAAALHGLLDEMDQSVDQGVSADEVEERARLAVRQVGLEALQGWAQKAHVRAQEQRPAGAVKHAQKNSGGKRSSGRSK